MPLAFTQEDFLVLDDFTTTQNSFYFSMFLILCQRFNSVEKI